MANPQEVLLKYLNTGQVLVNRYVLERPLGAGAYGAIFLAIDQITQEQVAVKALPPPSETQSKTALGRFMREMKIVKTLVHPNIICMYDFGEAEHNVPFMILEYIKGQTLERLVSGNPLGLDDGLDVLSQLVSALGAAHQQGVIHRDLKPANVMVSQVGGRFEVKVLDFGMAKILSRLGDETAADLTREGMAVGTPRYIAPEQARGLVVGPYTDLYAVGLLAYEIFAGERAVKDNTVEGAVRAHVSSKPLDLPLLDQVPQVVRPVLLKLLAKQIPARYQCAEDVLADIRRIEYARRKGSMPPLATAPKAKPAAPQVMEVDELAPPPTKPQAYTPPPSPSPSLFAWRPGQSGLDYVERVFAPALFLFGFVCLTAILAGYSTDLRALIGVIPGLVGGLVGWVAWLWYPRFGLTRGVLAGSLAAVVIPHLVDAPGLLANLLLHPLWFLEGAKSSGVVAPIYHVLSALIRAWAATLTPYLV